jgi:hypothetical protein
MTAFMRDCGEKPVLGAARPSPFPENGQAIMRVTNPAVGKVSHESRECVERTEPSSHGRPRERPAVDKGKR